MRIPRISPSILMFPPLIGGIVLNTVQIAQGASLVIDSTGSVDLLPLLEPSFSLKLLENGQSKDLFDILAQNSLSGDYRDAFSSNGSSAQPSDSSSKQSPGASLQSFVKTLSQLQFNVDKGNDIRFVPVLPQIQGSDVNEGIYSFSSERSASSNPFLARNSSLSGNIFSRGQARSLYRQGGFGSPISQFAQSNKDVEFDLLPANILKTSLSTAYQTSLSDAVNDLDSKFTLEIKTELRLMPDPILLSLNSIELSDFGSSKLTEARGMSIYSLQSKLNENFQQRTANLQERQAQRDKRLYKQLLKSKNFALSGLSSGSPNLGSSSINSSSLAPVAYSPVNQSSANRSNPEVSFASRPLLSNSNLTPKPLKTLPKSY